RQLTERDVSCHLAPRDGQWAVRARLALERYDRPTAGRICRRSSAWLRRGQTAFKPRVKRHRFAQTSSRGARRLRGHLGARDGRWAWRARVAFEQRLSLIAGKLG